MVMIGVWSWPGCQGQDMVGGMSLGAQREARFIGVAKTLRAIGLPTIPSACRSIRPAAPGSSPPSGVLRVSGAGCYALIRRGQRVGVRGSEWIGGLVGSGLGGAEGS